ncbi:hypothetical protein [Corynebacterium sp. HMSC064E10]|uniref:hypothetical protein n=1 Tax=Corynebacterium sp. HMSC064E10 TaxID=1739364 RepID=UPI0008A34C28|nr:hypothetical protein [Corynebacterium sp. HMSC064E10]
MCVWGGAEKAAEAHDGAGNGRVVRPRGRRVVAIHAGQSENGRMVVFRGLARVMGKRGEEEEGSTAG